MALSVKQNRWSRSVSKQQLSRFLTSGQQKFLVLEDLTLKYLNPCICDIKIGTRQHGDNAQESKIKRHSLKCENTTSKPLGIRLCGLQVFHPVTQRYTHSDKYEGRKLTPQSIQPALAQFFSDGSVCRVQVLAQFLDKLRTILSIMSKGVPYRFYSTSLLFIYEGENSVGVKGCPLLDLRMIDFAQTYPTDSSTQKDDGYLFGLTNLISLLEKIYIDEMKSKTI